MPLSYFPAPLRPVAAPAATNYSSQLASLIVIGTDILDQAASFNNKVEPDYTPRLDELADLLGVMNKLSESATVSAVKVGKETVAALHSRFVETIDKIAEFQTASTTAFRAMGESLASVITAQSDQVENLLAIVVEQGAAMVLEPHSLSLVAGEGGLSIEVAAGHSLISFIPYDQAPFAINGTQYNGGVQYNLEVGRGMQLPKHNIELLAGSRFTLLVHSDTRLRLGAPVVAGTSYPFVPEKSDTLEDPQLLILADQMQAAL